MKLKLTFQAASFERPSGVGKAIELMQCVQIPEIAVIKTRERFLWKTRYVFRKDETEYEMPSLKAAVVFAFQQNGIPGELLTDEIRKELEALIEEGKAGG